MKPQIALLNMALQGAVIFNLTSTIVLDELQETIDKESYEEGEIIGAWVRAEILLLGQLCSTNIDVIV